MERSFEPFFERPVPSSYEAALRGMIDRKHLASQAFQEQAWKATRTGAHPAVREFERVFCKRMAALGVPMYAHNMVRTREQQYQAWKAGHSKNDGSRAFPHQGFAVDIVHAVNHWNLSDLEWGLVGHVGEEIAKAKGLPIEWGGRWKFYDPAHWQLIGWRKLYKGFPFPPGG